MCAMSASTLNKELISQPCKSDEEKNKTKPRFSNAGLARMVEASRTCVAELHCDSVAWDLLHFYRTVSNRVKRNTQVQALAKQMFGQFLAFMCFHLSNSLCPHIQYFTLKQTNFQQSFFIWMFFSVWEDFYHFVCHKAHSLHLGNKLQTCRMRHASRSCGITVKCLSVESS